MPDTLNHNAHATASTRADNETSTRIFGPDQLRGIAARQRFIASLQPVLALRHPNLVRTRAVRERDETVAVVTDAVSAATLESILAGDPFLSLAAIHAILHQVAMALGCAHEVGVVHGALSTRSILITPEGDAIVADIGIVAALAVAGARRAADDPATLAYASPEAVRGEPCSPSSDQHSLGAIAYELLAGRRPFDGAPARLRRAHLGRRPEPLGALNPVHPDEWSRAVMRMIEKRPSDRFWSLADAVEPIVPPNGAQGEGFRATLGWLAQQQISGVATPVAPVATSIMDEVRALWSRPADVFAEPRVARTRRIATGVVCLIGIAVGAAAWRGSIPVTRLSTEVTQVEQRLAPEAVPPQMTTAAPPEQTTTASAPPPEQTTTATAPPPPRALPRAPSRAIPRAIPHSAPRRDTRAATASPTVPPFTAVAPASPALPPAEREFQPPARPPSIVVTAPASPFPSAAPVLDSISPTTVPALTTAQADAAARTLVDQLRRDDLRSLGSTMVASPGDADFLGWLRERSGEFEIGTPAGTRALPLPDGSVEVTYSVPIIWTHASGARRSRTAAITASVRPSPSGARLSSWLLAERFVP